MLNYYPLAKEVANDVKSRKSVTVIFHLNNGNDKFFFYIHPNSFYQTSTNCNKQYSTNRIANRINDEWCQSISDDGVAKITIAKYSG